ncbi:MAG: mechanosensitive ion channel domain-containing protein [Eubacteriales bacterium]
MQAFLDSLVEFATTAGLKIVYAAVVIVVGLKLVNMLVKAMTRGKLMSKLENGAHSFIISFVSIALKIIVFIAAAGILGVPMTSFITMLASAGLAIGLAFQGSLSNVAGGLMILIFHPFKAGDYIDTHSDSGTVKEINIFYTVLVTLDNRVITIPNGSISNSTIINYSAQEQRRVDLVFSAAYTSDIDKVKTILLDTCKAHPCVLADPEPFARLSKHNDSSLDFTVRVWVKAADYWTVYFDLTEQVKKNFDAAGIEIPFPQVDVHQR